MPIDKFPLVVKEFRGKLVNDIDNAFNKYSQGHIPFDYGLESSNLEYLKKGGMRTRRGIEEYIRFQSVTGVPAQFWKIEILNKVQYADRWLILTWDGVNGRIYDTGVVGPATNPILTIAGMKYAFVINAFDRMYICPWSGWSVPKSNSDIYVYNGSYNARIGGGAVPTFGPFAAAAAAGGVCTAGLHLIGVMFETDSGFRTILGDNSGGPSLSVTTTAANATINLTNIPVGAAGTGTVKRHIVMTKVIVNNNGKQFGAYEPFIVATINDNTTTILSINTPDSGLVDSAKEFVVVNGWGGWSLTPCISLAVYKNRMVYIGIKDSGGFLRNTILVSPVGIPEHCSVVNFGVGISTITVGPDFSGGVMIGAEQDNTFYIFKEDSTFSIVADDDLDPSEWPNPSLVDSSRGAFPFGVAQIGNNPSSLIGNKLIVGGSHGISIFNGGFPEKSLAESIWEEYDQDDLKWLKIIVDPIRSTLFAKIGDPTSENLIDGVTPNKSILFANYYNGYDINQIRWGKYILPIHISAGQLIAHDIAVREPNTPGTTGHAEWFKLPHSLLVVLDKALIAGSTYDPWLFSEAVSNADFGQTAIIPAYPSWEWESGYTPNESGETFTFGPLKLRINTKYIVPAIGDGNVTVEMGILDDSVVSSVGTLVPGITPKKFMSLPLNNVNEQLRIRIRGQNHSLIQSMILFATERGKERPR